uniref:Uncharacterized protein n=1 Tax=Clastoptera arizonana TaxID=38151 RepID=A0A1B6CMV5_9HEMI
MMAVLRKKNVYEESQALGKDENVAFLLPQRTSPPPKEAPPRRWVKTHDLDDFEVIDDLPEEDKNTIRRLKYFDFRRKKPLKYLMTREISRYFDRETYLKTSFKEMILFIGFLIILCLMSFSSANPSMFYYSKVMTRLFVNTKFRTDLNQKLTLFEINEIEHVWAYILKVALKNFYWEFWFSRFHQTSLVEPEDDTHILYENKLIGVPRIRQVRVRNDSCTVLPEFKNRFAACYGTYNQANEDKAPFGFQLPNTAWTYRSDSEVGSHTYSTDIAKYGGGGYYVDLNTTYRDSMSQIEELQEYIWINRGTRAVFIDFTTYNANINLFCMVKIIFEVLPTGGVLPSFDFSNQKLISYVDAWDFVILVFEILFVVYFIFYTIEEFYEITYFKWHYLTKFWNWIDLIILVLCYIVVTLKIYMYVNVSNSLEKLIAMKDSHPVFDDITSGQSIYNIALTVLIFLSWVKLLKYLSINKSMYEMMTTLQRASVDILSFSIIICTVFVGFAEYAHLKFGNQVNDWKSLPDSVFSLLRSIVGEFDYAAIERSDPVFGPLFFFAFLFFIFFILINMYLAIIIDAYANVRSEVKSGGVKTHLSDLISRFFNTFLRKIGCKRYAENRERKAEAAYNKAVYQDIRQFFLRCGYTDKEIDIFFAKYEITEESLINPEEMNKVIQKIQETPIRGPVGAEIPDRINMDNLQNFSFVLF